jgi:DNA sulfur modification protein DndB
MTMTRPLADMLSIPALRATMGDWMYYIGVLKLRDVARRISIAEEIHVSETLQGLLQRQLSNRSGEIEQYLLTHPQRFFNALVVGTYGGNPNWYELDVQTDGSALAPLPRAVQGILGVLTLEGSEKLWAIDGQHRVAGIRRAVAANEQLGDEEICVIFVRGVASGNRHEDPEGFERTRRLFSTLNQNAKAVSKKDIIALDEDDVVAIVTRLLVEEHRLVHNKVSIGLARQIAVSDRQSLTSIEVLYDVLNRFLRDRSPQRWNESRTNRPDDEVIERYYRRSVEFFEILAQHFKPLRELAESEPGDKVAGKYRHSEGGHLLFRPIGLLMVVRVLRRLMDTGTSLGEAMSLISRVPMELTSPPWVGLLWNRVSHRMITSGENIRVAERLLFYGVGGNLNQYRTDIDALRREYAGMLGDEPDSVQIDTYI